VRRAQSEVHGVRMAAFRDKLCSRCPSCRTALVARRRRLLAPETDESARVQAMQLLGCAETAMKSVCPFPREMREGELVVDVCMCLRPVLRAPVAEGTFLWCPACSIVLCREEALALRRTVYGEVRGEAADTLLDAWRAHAQFVREESERRRLQAGRAQSVRHALNEVME